jgi:L-Lysine epsilon oxidase N-terminal/L-lysine epsilon oxidase C-terminal domain
MAKPIICIHPSIGIARVGNSEEWFIGPEIPGLYPSIENYRDDDGKLKRQAARFRLFQYEDEKSREITLKNVKSIQWIVHLRNTKAAAPRCSGVLKTKSTLRNPRVKNRRLLILDAKPQKICRANSEIEAVCSHFMGRPFAKPLKLGTLLTDSEGRLLVLGGYGRSGSLTGATLNEKNGNDFANHDGWYDDTSDGSVKAVVTLKDNSTIHAESSWVIVAPPKYAPELQSVTTLYDTLYQKAIKDKLLPDPFRPEHGFRTKLSLRSKKNPLFRPSFRHEIYPILRRAMDLRWVFSKMGVAHERQFSITRARNDATYRQHIFRQFRVPSPSEKRPGSGTGTMPYLWSDLFPHPVNATVTQHQYDILRAWSKNEFEDDWKEPAIVRSSPTAEGLDRAALEACVGAAFYPGIECSFYMRDKFRYVRPFRLDPRSLKPGDITAQMSIPWQSDFVDCSDEDPPFVWWPAQRPIDVVLEKGARKKRPPYPTVRWARGFPQGKRDVTAVGMVRDWHRLGLIGRYKDRFVEMKRVETDSKS